MSIYILLIFLNIKISQSITCISYSGSSGSSYQSKTNVTGPGDQCCATLAWAGSFFGVQYQPYNSQTEICCKSNSYFVGNVQYQSNSIGRGDTCCNGLAYYNSTGICCSTYNSNNVGPGDACCGTKPYYKNKQACCEYFISAINTQTYAVGDECCKFGTLAVNKTFQVCK